MPSKLVVVIDDDALVADLVQDIIHGELGVACLTAPRAGAGLALVRRRHPDLVLLDIVMGEVDGFEACHRLKADPLTRDIPVVAFSALNAGEYAERARRVGCAEWIAKPFEINDLLARVEGYLRGVVGAVDAGGGVSPVTVSGIASGTAARGVSARVPGRLNGDWRMCSPGVHGLSVD
jgi:CheY-like chemotaxis protein